MIVKIVRRWWWLLALLGIGLVYFGWRLPNLTLWPVFVDEAIYIRWAQVMRAEQTLRFLPLSDGKQPLFMWLVIPSFQFFNDPLLAGRIVSVLVGWGTLLGLYFLGLKLFNSQKIALLAGLLYAVVPFTVFFDRLALVDSLLSMFGVWLWLLAVLLVRYQRLDLAMIAGMFLGGAFLTKSPAIFFAVLMPTALLLVLFESKKREKKWFLKFVGLWLVVYLFALGIYNFLRLGPNFHLIAQRSRDYVFPLSHIWVSPWDPFRFHLKDIWQWGWAMLTWPILFLGLIGIVWGAVKQKGIVFLLLTWLAIPLLMEAELARVFTARYILFVVPVFLLLAAMGANWLLEKIWKFKLMVLFLVILVLGRMIRFDWLIINFPERAPLPRNERAGYLEEWTAGTGIREAAGYLRERAKSQKILVGTEGYFGTLPDGLQMYLEKVPNIRVIGVGVNLGKLPESLKLALVDNEVYLLINDSRLKFDANNGGLNLIARYPKAKRPDGTNESLLLFQVK